MSVDILGTDCDQCRGMVQCCFTSTETVRLIRTESPGRPPRLSHSSWTLGWWQCSDSYIISPTSIRPSLTSLMVSVDVKHHERRRPYLTTSNPSRSQPRVTKQPGRPGHWQHEHSQNVLLNDEMSSNSWNSSPLPFHGMQKWLTTNVFPEFRVANFQSERPWQVSLALPQQWQSVPNTWWMIAFIQRYPPLWNRLTGPPAKR